MTERQGAAWPRAALLTDEPAVAAPLAWEEAQARLAAGRYYWLTTVHPRNGPQPRPVLAVWAGGFMCTTSTTTARKGRNLARDPRCALAVMADDMHVVLEGRASPVKGAEDLELVADAYRVKYNWPVTVVDGAFQAPYGAPTAGPPPYHPYRVEPVTAYAFVTEDSIGPRHTRWTFERRS